MAGNGIDMFADALQGGGARQRIVQQNRFEYRVACAIIRAFESVPGAGKAVIDRLGDVSIFDVRNMGFPLHLVTVKLKKTLAVHDILKFLMKTPLKLHVEEAVDTFQEEPFGIIFASDGDGMQDMILYNEPNIHTHMEEWYAGLPQYGLWLSTLKGFLAAARKHYDSWYIAE